MNGRILIIGVTASGKGRLAFELARKIDAEIISVDSMKVYRRMDIGTAKPPRQAREKINYHLLDVAEPSESFSVAEFLNQTTTVVSNIEKQHKPVIAVGGTALYIKSLLFGLFEGPGTNEKTRTNLHKQAQANGLSNLYQRLTEIDPTSAKRIHPNDEKRIIRAIEVYEMTGKPISVFQKQWSNETEASDRWTVIGLRREKQAESSRINSRVKKMIETGLVDEVKGLLSEENPLSKQARCAIGYAEVIDYLEGKNTLEETVEKIKINTRRLAKGQRTWFKTFKNVNWLDIEADDCHEKILTRTEQLLRNL